jgi:glycosyltransferase involved in cell wall biosynthesis
MEAMARGKIVLAPAITGIPELVRAGATGFLYERGSVEDCVAHLRFIYSQMTGHQRAAAEAPGDESAGLLEQIKRRAVAHIDQNFNRNTNLQSFGDSFLQRTAAASGNRTHANLILQQI